MNNPMTYEIDSHFCYDAYSNIKSECPKCRELGLIKDKPLRAINDYKTIQGWEAHCPKCGIRGTIINA